MVLLLRHGTGKVKGDTAAGGSHNSPQSQGLGYRSPAHHGVAGSVLDEQTWDDALGPGRGCRWTQNATPAKRKGAHQIRCKRGGRMVTTRAPAGGAKWTSPYSALCRMRGCGVGLAGCFMCVKRVGPRVYLEGWEGQLPRGECRHDEAPVAGLSGRWGGRVRTSYETYPDSETGKYGGEAGWVGIGILWGQPSPLG